MTDKIAIPIRVDALRNVFNLAESAVDVTVYRTDLHDFVIIEDIGRGASVTNAAESICPQVSERLMLPWKRCVFIEKYPASNAMERFDPTFDRIFFIGEPVGWHVSAYAEPVPMAKLGRWIPLGLALARALQAVGLEMSSHVGSIGTFESYADGTCTDVLITAYDGRSYYTVGDRLIPGRFLGPAEEATKNVAL